MAKYKDKDALMLSCVFASDVDECSENTDNCSQGCNNTIGSYLCYCEDGYTLDTDLHTCNGKMNSTEVLNPKRV